MKRVLLAVAVLATGGCLRVEQTFTLRENGSGTIDCTYAIPEQTLQQLRAAGRLTAEMDRAAAVTAAPPPGRDYLELFAFETEDKIKREFASLKPHGVTLRKLKAGNRDGRREVELSVTFDSLAELARTDLFRRYGFSLTKNSDGDYVLQRKPPNREKTDVPDFSKPEAARELAPLLGGFYVQVRVNTPARILRTNAPNKGARTVAWTFDFDNRPESFLAFQNEGMGLVFEGKDIQLPDVRPDEAPAGN